MSIDVKPFHAPRKKKMIEEYQQHKKTEAMKEAAKKAAKQGAKDFLRGVDAYQPLPELPDKTEVATMKGPGDDWTTAVEIMKSLWPKRPRGA